MHSNCILDYVANPLVCHMMFVGNVQKSPIAWIFLSISAVKLALKCIKEGNDHLHRIIKQSNCRIVLLFRAVSPLVPVIETVFRLKREPFIKISPPRVNKMDENNNHS